MSKINSHIIYSPCRRQLPPDAALNAILKKASAESHIYTGLSAEAFDYSIDYCMDDYMDFLSAISAIFASFRRVSPWTRL